METSNVDSSSFVRIKRSVERKEFRRIASHCAREVPDDDNVDARADRSLRNLLFALASRRSMTITRDGSMIITRRGRETRGMNEPVNAANRGVPSRRTVSSMRNNRLRRTEPRLQHSSEQLDYTVCSDCVWKFQSVITDLIVRRM